MPKVEFLYLPENGKSDLGLNLGVRNSVLQWWIMKCQNHLTMCCHRPYSYYRLISVLKEHHSNFFSLYKVTMCWGIFKKTCSFIKIHVNTLIIHSKKINPKEPTFPWNTTEKNEESAPFHGCCMNKSLKILDMLPK